MIVVCAYACVCVCGKCLLATGKRGFEKRHPHIPHPIHLGHLGKNRQVEKATQGHARAGLPKCKTAAYGKTGIEQEKKGQEKRLTIDVMTLLLISCVFFLLPSLLLRSLVPLFGSLRRECNSANSAFQLGARAHACAGGVGGGVGCSSNREWIARGLFFSFVARISCRKFVIV